MLQYFLHQVRALTIVRVGLPNLGLQTRHVIAPAILQIVSEPEPRESLRFVHKQTFHCRFQARVLSVAECKSKPIMEIM